MGRSSSAAEALDARLKRTAVSKKEECFAPPPRCTETRERASSHQSVKILSTLAAARTWKEREARDEAHDAVNAIYYA